MKHAWRWQMDHENGFVNLVPKNQNDFGAVLIGVP